MNQCIISQRWEKENSIIICRIAASPCGLWAGYDGVQVTTSSHGPASDIRLWSPGYRLVTVGQTPWVFSHSLANLPEIQKQVKLVGLCCKQSCHKRFTLSSLWMWTSGACNQDTGAKAERGEAGSNQSGQVSQSQKMRGPLWQTRERDASIPGLHSMNAASQSFWQLQDGIPSPPTHSHSSLCSKGKFMN